jgi:hypothetical protein
MFLGILEPRDVRDVPGTVYILDEPTEQTVRNPNLKYDKTGTIILVPQPSDDPNDPLVRTGRVVR